MSDEQCPPDETFNALMRGGLTSSERAAFHAHVDGCRSCQLVLRQLAGGIDIEAVLEGTCTSAYRIEARLGQGGMGLVYRATDAQLGRSVALKLASRLEASESAGSAETPGSSAAGSGLDSRFLREALLTARLQHPGIVSIHQVGRWPSGDAFYTMKLISGRSLQDLIDAAVDLDDRLAMLPQVLAAADAVGYAHAQGVIHRDLKPANIMCGSFGETVVIDWGLAKQLDAEASPDDPELDRRVLSQTSPGVVLGTPSYMAPEQVRGEQVDARADVYSLGIILQHLLVGAPTAQPGRSVTWPPGAPPDLIALVGKAAAADPRERYATAKQLADDLRRFHTGQLVGARVYTTPALLWRWLARHRSLVLLAALFVGILITSVVVSVRRIVREQQAATASRNDLVLLQARSVLARDPTETLGWLKLADGPTVDWTTVRAIAEDAVGRGTARHLFRGHDGPVGVVAVIPGGRLIASLGKDGAVWLWNVSTGRGSVILRHPGVVNLVVSADGAVVAASGRDGVELYWLATARHCLVRVSTGAVTAIAMAADQRGVVMGSDDGAVEIASCEGSATRAPGRHAGVVNAIAAAPVGGAIASAGADGAIALWVPASGQYRTLRGHQGEVLAIDFRKDGQAFASGGADATVRIWSVATGEAQILRGHKRMVHDVKFAPIGSMVASAGVDWHVVLWNSATGESRTLVWDQVPWVVAFSPSGNRLAVAGLGGGVRIWDLAGRYSSDLRGHKGAVYDVAFSSEETVATSGEDGSVRVWDVADATGSRVDLDTTGVRYFALSRESALIALGGIAANPSVRLRTSDGAERILGTRTGGVLRVALSADGHWLAATGSPDRAIGLWNLGSGEQVELRGHDDAIEDLVFSPDGALLASAGLDGTVGLWDTGSARERMLRGHQGWVYSVAFSSDSKHLVSGGKDGTVRLWDLATGASRVLLEHPGQVRVVTFSRDGRWVASGDLVSGVGISEVASGRGRILAGHKDWVYAVAFSSDGRRLASGSADGTVRLWTVPWNDSRVLTRHDDAVRSVAFSPDGNTVVSGGHDATVRVSSIETGATRVLHGHANKVFQIAFTPDGKHILSRDEGGALIQWSVPALSDAALAMPGSLTAWLAQLTSAVIESDHRLATPLRGLE